MAVIRVPKPPKSAFNKRRPAGQLLLSQIEHLEWVTKSVAQRATSLATGRATASRPVAGKARKRRKRLTEGEAAEYIAHLTGLLHQGTAKPADAGAAPRPLRRPRIKTSARRTKTAPARRS